jgi:hypothetical protein
VDRLHRDSVTIWKMDILRHCYESFLRTLCDSNDMISNCLETHSQLLNMQGFRLDPTCYNTAISQSPWFVDTAYGTIRVAWLPGHLISPIPA